MRILYVENHAVFTTQVRQRFLSAHAVQVVSSLAAARQLLASENYDLLLVDYDLDDGKGDELVQACRVLRPQIHIIAVSAHEAGNHALLKAGASAVCSKMEFDKIQSVIDKLPAKTASRGDNLTPHQASEYDLKVRQTIPFYETIHREVIRLVSVIKPDAACWLDTGCGTGYLPEQALQAFPQTHFILADPAVAMLTQSRARLAATAADRFTILPPTDSAGLISHIRPGTADVVTAIQCHHYLNEASRMKALQACFETLKPGGLFVTFENVAPCTDQGVRFGLKAWKAFLITQGRTEEEADKHLARYGTEFFPIAAKQHLRCLTQVGFKVVEPFWFSQMQAGFYAIK